MTGLTHQSNANANAKGTAQSEAKKDEVSVAGRKEAQEPKARKEGRKETDAKKDAKTARELEAKDKKEKKMADENNEKYETKRRMRKTRLTTWLRWCEATGSASGRATQGEGTGIGDLARIERSREDRWKEQELKAENRGKLAGRSERTQD